LLEDAAIHIGKRSLAEHARARRESISGDYRPYDEDNLVSAGGKSVVAAGVQ